MREHLKNYRYRCPFCRTKWLERDAQQESCPGCGASNGDMFRQQQVTLQIAEQVVNDPTQRSMF